MTTLGRYPRPVADSPAYDGPYNALPGADRDLFFVRSNIPAYAASADLEAVASGVALGVPIWLEQGDVVSTVTFVSGATAAVTPTHSWVALYTPEGALAAQSATQGTAAWAANTARKITLAAPYTVPKRGWYTAAVMVAAATVPTLAGTAPLTGTASAAAGLRPLGRTFGSGLTSTAPATIASPTTVAKCPLVIVS